MTLKVSQENMQVIYHIGHKILCDGYVIARNFLFDGYLIEAA